MTSLSRGKLCEIIEIDQYLKHDKGVSQWL